MNTPTGESSAGSELEAMARQFQESDSRHDGRRRHAVDGGCDQPGDGGHPRCRPCRHLAVAEGRHPGTVYPTDELPVRVDSVQYTLDEGPCVLRWSRTTSCGSTTCRPIPQFPRFGPAAVELGVRSMLSTRLHALRRRNRAALNLYATRTDRLPLRATPDRSDLCLVRLAAVDQPAAGRPGGRPRTGAGEQPRDRRGDGHSDGPRPLYPGGRVRPAGPGQPEPESAPARHRIGGCPDRRDPRRPQADPAGRTD